MRALIDTCVIIDVLQNREPFAKNAQDIFLSVANNQYIGCITAKSSTDIYYLTHRYTHDNRSSREILNKLFTLFEVLDTSGMDCRRAVLSEVSDFKMLL
jgi:predicted nucleic acid-binding protein